MPTVDVIGIDGQKVGEVALADDVFAARIHVPAMHQVVVAYLAAQRQGTHSTKTRGEVRGGGRKPWKHTLSSVDKGWSCPWSQTALVRSKGQ